MPLSFGVLMLHNISNWKRLDSEEDHMKQMDEMTILLMSANFLQLSSMFLHNGLKSNVSMVSGWSSLTKHELSNMSINQVQVGCCSDAHGASFGHPLWQCQYVVLVESMATEATCINFNYILSIF